MPDFHDQFTSWTSFDATLVDAVAEYEETVRPLTPEQRKSLQDPEARRRIKKNAGVIALKGSGEEAEAALASRGLGVVRIKNYKKSFLIGSMPMIKLTRPGQTHLADPRVELWLPISHDVAVGPSGEAGTETFGIISEGNIRALNEGIAKQSTVFAGRSRDLIVSIARRYR